VKRRIVREREFENIRLESEEVAEFEYCPVACQKSYRLVVVRKNLAIEQSQQSRRAGIRVSRRCCWLSLKRCDFMRRTE